MQITIPFKLPTSTNTTVTGVYYTLIVNIYILKVLFGFVTLNLG